MSEQRRSGIPQPASGLPRRAPSPSSAAFSSSRNSTGGPLGAYRPVSREASDRPMSRNGESAPRFGIPTSTSTSSMAPKGVQGKRTHSSAGLRDPETPGPNGSGSKRPLLTSSSATPSPRFPQSTSSYDVSMLKSEYERRELLSKQAMEKLQNEFKAGGRETERLRQEKLSLLRQWEEANMERKEEKESFEEQRKFLNDRVNTLLQQNQELRAGWEEVQAEKTRLAQSWHEEETKQSLRMNALEFELASAKARAEEHKEGRDKAALALDAREKEWEEERQRLERRREEGEESNKLTGGLSELLSKIHTLEGETLGLEQDNRSLKTRLEGVAALKEHTRDLEEKLTLMGELRRKNAEAEARIRELETERAEWNRRLSDGTDDVAFESMQAGCATVDAAIPSVEAPSPLTIDNLATYLSCLQGAVSGLVARSRGLEERVQNAGKQRDDAERTSLEESTKRKKVEEDLELEKMERLKSVKMADAAKMEMESYVKLLDTFQEESRNQSTPDDAAPVDRTQVLEDGLKTVTEASGKDAGELEKPGEGSVATSSEERERLERGGEVEELLRALEESRKEGRELERQCVELGKINDQLYLRVGRGEFDQTRERCLELKDNPVSQDRAIRTATLEALRKENEQLLRQVEELSQRVASSQGGESIGEGSLAMVPAQTLENQRREYEKLEQAMRNRDKAFDRLKEVFGAKATEYVAAVKALFGYDMHVVSKGKVKLRSVYARTSKGTSLTFDSGEDSSEGKMKLVGEARQGIAVGNLQDYWLGNDRFSVPCFLAALQLELYEGTTRAIRGTWASDEEQ